MFCYVSVMLVNQENIKFFGKKVKIYNTNFVLSVPARPSASKPDMTAAAATFQLPAAAVGSQLPAAAAASSSQLPAAGTAAAPQMPAAGTPGLTLKDYLPFMKPKTFGADAGKNRSAASSATPGAVPSMSAGTGMPQGGLPGLPQGPVPGQIYPGAQIPGVSMPHAAAIPGIMGQTGSHAHSMPGSMPGIPGSGVPQGPMAGVPQGSVQSVQASLNNPAVPTPAVSSQAAVTEYQDPKYPIPPSYKAVAEYKASSNEMKKKVRKPLFQTWSTSLTFGPDLK